MRGMLRAILNFASRTKLIVSRHLTRAPKLSRRCCRIFSIAGLKFGGESTNEKQSNSANAPFPNRAIIIPIRTMNSNNLIIRRTPPVILALGALCILGSAPVRSQTIDSMPPVIIKTIPESGAIEVSPGEFEIKVTFSKKMTDGSWSWSTAWQDSSPKSLGKPKYEADGKTCVMKVKLEPGKTYAYWLNSNKFKNFKDQQGNPSVPYLLIFKTKDK